MTAADILNFRTSLDLSQRELADRLGVSHVAVCHWETGKRQPSRPVLLLLEAMRQEAKRSTEKHRN